MLIQNKRMNAIAIRCMYVFLGCVFIYSIIISLLTGYLGFISICERIIWASMVVALLLLVLSIYRKHFSILIQSLRWLQRKLPISRLIIIGGVMRISWVLLSGVDLTSDFKYYDNMAISILNSQYFLNPAKPSGVSIIFALHYHVFGHHPIIPLITISILSTIQIFAVYKIAYYITENSFKAWIAALCIVFLPEHIFFNNLLGSDVIYSAFIWAAVYFIARDHYLYEMIRMRILLMLGCLFGFSHWVRPTTPVFVLIVFFYLTIRYGKKGLCWSLVIISVVGLWLLPIIYMNNKEIGVISIMPSQTSGLPLMVGTYIEGYGRRVYWEKSPNSKRFLNAVKNRLEVTQEHPQVAYNREAKLIAIKHFRDNPFGVFFLGFQHKLSNYWGMVASLGFSLDTSILSSISKPLWGISDLSHKLITFIAALGLLKSSRSKTLIWNEISMMILFACMMTGVHFIFESVSRYHHYFLPLIALLVAGCTTKESNIASFEGKRV